MGTAAGRGGARAQREDMKNVASILAGLLLVCGLGACSGGARGQPVRVHVGAAGATPAAVFYPEDVAGVVAHLGPGPERGRLNGDLAWRPATPLLATNEWPQAGRPDVRERRRIFIEDRSNSFIFFLQRSERPPARPWPY